MVLDVLPSVNLMGNDIRDTLNANGGSVTDEAVTWFQDRAKLNIWSLNKPFRYAQYFNIDATAKKNRRYGFGHIIAESSAVTANGKAYIYELPRGGSEEPYRIEDFAGYKRIANPPIDVQGSHFGNLDWDMSVEESFILEVWPNSSDGEMHVGDFHSMLGDMYLGVCVIDRSNPDNYQWKTGMNKFKENGALALWLYNTESAFLSSYVEYFLIASSTYKETFGESAPDGTVFLPIPSLEGNKYSLNITNWETTLPTALLRTVIINGTGYTYGDNDSSFDTSESSLRLGLEFSYENLTNTEFYIEPDSLVLSMTGNSGKLEAWYYGPPTGMNIAAGGMEYLTIDFSQSFNGPEQGSSYTVSVDMNYKGNALLSCRFELRR